MLATGADAHRNGLEGSEALREAEGAAADADVRAGFGRLAAGVGTRASFGRFSSSRASENAAAAAFVRPDGAPVRTPSRFAMPVLRAALALITLAFAIAVFPNPALAAEVLCSQTDIVAQAQTDGSLHVTEQRVFTTDDSSVRLKWSFAGVSAGSEAEISSMRAAAVDEEGNVVGEWENLPRPLSKQAGVSRAAPITAHGRSIAWRAWCMCSSRIWEISGARNGLRRR